MNSSGTINSVGHSQPSPILMEDTPYPALFRLNQLVAEKKYGKASTELILKLQTERPASKEQLSLICRHYKTIISEGELEQPEIRSLRQNYLKFLKQLLPSKQLLTSYTLAERQLVDEVNAL